MPRNVEIKACVKDLSEFKSLAQSLSGEEPVLIKQQDTFFNVSNGRLKLRVLEVTLFLLSESQGRITMFSAMCELFILAVFLLCCRRALLSLYSIADLIKMDLNSLTTTSLKSTILLNCGYV